MGNQQEESNGKTLIETLTKRFTCKRYDPEGGVSDDDFATILEAARLSPSSFGFEPWKLLVIERPGLVDEIREQAWGAKRNADRTVVILARRDVTAESAWVHHIAHDIQGLSEADEQTRLETFAKLQRDDLHVLDNERTLFDWAGKQTYIALANMLTAAALLGVDATPIEGYNRDGLEKLLAGHGLYNKDDWGISVLVQFGVHDATHRPVVKTRRPIEEVVEWVR